MKTEIIISILGALTAICVSFIGAFLTSRNSINLQMRKQKEDHYTKFLEALHNNAASGNETSLKNYVLARDKMFIVASEDVIKKLLLYEENGVGNTLKDHDKHLTTLIKAIRKDLKIKDKSFPFVGLKKGTE